jgi:phospholipase C
MSERNKRLRSWRGAGLALAGLGLVAAPLSYVATQGAAAADGVHTATPITHLVVLFDENESFDHYFGTYPKATNTDGTPFTAAAGTPTAVDNYVSHPGLLSSNPNTVAPYRLSHSQAWTCSQNHAYTPEQKAVNAGSMDKFVENTSTDTCTGAFNKTGETMGYYDGNTVTSLWNYAQHYSMSDNSWADNFGPSTVGALNVVSGQTYGAINYNSVYDATSNPSNVTDPATSTTAASGVSAVGVQTAGVGTVIGDPDPVYDDCADLDHTRTSNLAGMTGKNVGDLLNDAGVSWGYFAGGFTPTTPWDGQPGHYAKCDAMSANIAHTTGYDYNPHHNPFAYYKSTSNPHHVLPASQDEIGHDGQANHQYDLSYFYDALDNDNLPAVSYVKPIYAEDGHPGNSDPIDEQRFLTRTINAIEQSPDWASTAIVVAYDDSDGWYDHVAPTIINGSSTTDDVATCNTAPSASAPLAGHQDRCGPSQRLPFLVISPWAKENYVDHTHTSQASVVKFIEDNWELGTTIGDGSFDQSAGDLSGMFDFQHPQQTTLTLRYDGSVKAEDPTTVVPPEGFKSTVAATAPHATYGRPATVSVDVTSDGDVSGGTVRTTVDGVRLADKILSGPIAKVSLPRTLRAGQHTVKLTYTGSAETAAADPVSVTVHIAKAPTVTTVKAAKPNHGQVPVTVTVTAPGSSLVPTGKVSHTVDGKQLGPVALKHGVATFTVPVTKGKRTLVVHYLASADYAGSASRTVTITR